MRSAAPTIAAGGLSVLAAVVARRRHDRRLSRRGRGASPGVRTDDGVQLYVEIDGPEDAPLTVVFAHGFCARMEEYDEQRRGLREHHRLVFFDQRGHGRSGWSGHRSATLSQLARDLGQVIDQFGGDGPVAVVGHSMGGMALTALACSRPELFDGKVVAVALVSTSAGRFAPDVPRPIAQALYATKVMRPVMWVKWLTAPITDRLGVARTRPARRLIERRLFGAGPAPEHLVDEAQQMVAGTPRAMASAFYPSMLDHDTTRCLSAFADIASLVLAGDEDATIPTHHSDRIAAAIGDRAQLVHVPGAGHMANMTHPDAVNDALRRLFTEALDDEGHVVEEPGPDGLRWPDDVHRGQRRGPR